MKAMILAAGRGERMRPLTDTCPKPLLPVQGKPLIEWHIERFVRAGIRDLVINHAWLGDKIEAVLGSGERWGVKITYSPETSALETAAGIAKALPHFGDMPFWVINADVWTDWEIPHQNQALCTQEQPVHMILVENPSHHPQGDFAYNTSLNTFSNTSAHTLTFAGIAQYHPAFFKDVTHSRPQKLGPLLHQAIAQNQASGCYYQGCWVDVGPVERLEKLNQPR